MIEAKSYLPNVVQRLCTQHLKIDAMKRFVQDRLGFEEIERKFYKGGSKTKTVRRHWSTAVGIRYDEPKRWRIIGVDTRNPRETKFAPLVTDKVTEEDVMQFWSKMPFDLKLSQGEGNCDLCFMKGIATKERIIREHPELADWWASKEIMGDKRRLWSSKSATYTALIERARRQLPLLPDLSEGTMDCACTD